MIDKIKYIAAYQVAPVPGITHIAEVDRIEKYNDTDKYIVYFKDGTTQKIGKVGLGGKKGQAPQAPHAFIVIIPSDRCSQTDLASRSFPELDRTPTDEARSR